MKKAIIKLGASQHIVSEGDVLKVSIAVPSEKKLKVASLLTIDDSKITVGAPEVAGSTVELSVEGQERAEKVTAIRYKAKKRVHKVRGHKQHLVNLKVQKIS